MKTPKRDCDWCNSWELEHCGRSWCGDCERGKRMFAQSSRWIRKNREARLRHALWKHRFFVQQLEDYDKRWNKLVSMYNRDGLLLLEAARVYRASGTCGQDVEGS